VADMTEQPRFWDSMARRRLVIATAFIIFFVGALAYLGGTSVRMWFAQGGCLLIGAIIGSVLPAGDDRPPLATSGTAGAAASIASGGLLVRLLFPGTGFVMILCFLSLAIMAGLLTKGVKAIVIGAVNGHT
jgi:hypothetical protein